MAKMAGPDQSAPDNVPYADWPIKINQLENYGRKVVGHLDEISVDGKDVIHLVDQETNEIIYAYRPPAGKFKPMVFDLDRTYTIKRFRDMELVENLDGLKAIVKD